MRRRKTVSSGLEVRGRMVAQALLSIRLLMTGRWRAAELASALGVGRRTTYRLLHVLDSAGVRIEHQAEGKEVYLRIRREDVLRALGLGRSR